MGSHGPNSCPGGFVALPSGIKFHASSPHEAGEGGWMGWRLSEEMFRKFFLSEALLKHNRFVFSGPQVRQVHMLAQALTQLGDH